MVQSEVGSADEGMTAAMNKKVDRAVQKVYDGMLSVAHKGEDGIEYVKALPVTMSKKEVNGERAGFLETYGLPVWTFPLTILFVILFAICTDWDENSSATITSVQTTAGFTVHERTVVGTTMSTPVMTYAMYMDCTAMCVLGFGFLYVFSKYYVWGGVGLNFLICGFCFIWVPIAKCFVHSMFDGHFHKTHMNLETMVSNNYVTAAVLISFGAFYGMVSPTQIIIISIIEPFLMIVNEHLVFEELHVQDAGGSMVTHMFGAYFGVAVVFALGVKNKHIPEKHRITTYWSDMGAMIGCIVLWMFWPSFNAALLYNDVTIQQRVITNTYLAICASCITGFATSSLAHTGKFEMIEIQNATLAGGVIIGTICSFLIDPWVAVLIGAIGGVLSSLGYAYLHPFLEDAGFTDSAGVQMLHGIPGMLGGLFAALACLADNTNYMFSYNTQWTTSVNCDRSRGQQFGYGIGAIAVSLAISIVGGLITGLIIRLPWTPGVERQDMIIDHDFWNIHDKGHDPRERRKPVVLGNINVETKA